MSDRDNEQTILCDFAGGPDLLEAAIAGLDETSLDLAMGADAWTIRQIVHHVVDGDDIWKGVIKAALGKPRRVHALQWYWDVPQLAWSETWAYSERELQPSLDLLRASRRHVLQLLTQIPGSLTRSLTMRWPSSEEVQITVAEIIEMQSAHLAHHVSDIEAIREAHRL